MRAVFALALCLSLAPAAARAAGDCAAQLQDTLATIPTLEARDFDAGWRALSERECHREAAQAIATYIEARGHVYHLSFHQAQMLLYAGERAKARPLLLASLRPELPEDAPFKWNAYVLAHVAWIDGDRGRFQRERAHLEAGRDYPPNAMNLKVLDAMLANLAGDYLQAMKAMQAGAQAGK